MTRPCNMHIMYIPLRVWFRHDPRKAAANLKKHGVSFADAEGALEDPLALTVEDPDAEGEQRFITVGLVSRVSNEPNVSWSPAQSVCFVGRISRRRNPPRQPFSGASAHYAAFAANAPYENCKRERDNECRVIQHVVRRERNGKYED